MTEAWNFLRDNMPHVLNRQDFNATFAMIDTDRSGGLNKAELAVFIMRMRNP